MNTDSLNQNRNDILQAQLGDDLAFTRLVERYQTPVYNLCYRMLGNPSCAEDAAQESFLRAFQNIRRFDPQRSFASWLLSITTNYCIDQLRRRKFGFLSLDQFDKLGDLLKLLEDHQAVHPEAACVRSEQQSALQKALTKLKAVDRAAVILRYWYGFSDSEIADTLRLSVLAVKSRLFRARRKIAVLLDDPEQYAILRPA